MFKFITPDKNGTHGVSFNNTGPFLWHSGVVCKLC